jgi:hypothetical protein
MKNISCHLRIFHLTDQSTNYGPVMIASVGDISSVSLLAKDFFAQNLDRPVIS